jgi:ATP-dependent DNA ligase
MVIEYQTGSRGVRHYLDFASVQQKLIPNPQTRVENKSMNPAYRPMLATLVDYPFDDQRWVFETKWDGFRLITEKRGHAVGLWSRNGIDVTARYAVLLPALQKIDGSCVIDGELCALDAHGRSRFQLLQNALNKKVKLLYVVFDALFVGGKDNREKPLLERKKILKALLPRDPQLRYSQHVAEFGRREFAKAQRAHEEGVIATSFANKPDQPSNALLEAARRAEEAKRLITVVATGVNYSAFLSVRSPRKAGCRISSSQAWTVTGPLPASR